MLHTSLLVLASVVASATAAAPAEPPPGQPAASPAKVLRGSGRKITVKYSPVKLVAGGVVLPGAQEAELTASIGGATCTLPLNPGGLLAHASTRDCEQIWGAPELPTFDVRAREATYHLVPEAAEQIKGDDAAVKDDGSIDVGNEISGLAAIFASHERGWVGVALDAPAKQVPARAPVAADVKALRAAGGGQLYVVAQKADGKLARWTFQVKAGPQQPPAVAPRQSLSGGDRQRLTTAAQACRTEGAVLIVLDARDGTVRRTMDFGGDWETELLPNKPVSVATIAPAGLNVHVSSKGKAGDTLGATLNAPPPAGAVNADTVKETEVAAPTKLQVVCTPLAPRTPGDATLQVSLGTLQVDGSEKATGPVDVDLFVRTVYSGALRLGISMIPIGVERSFSARPIPGGGASEVIDNGTSAVNFEVVVGYAPFLLERLFSDRGGRIYGRNGTPWFLRFAPYVGLGLLAPSSATSVDWLKSIYVGAEYEVFPNFSVGLTYVARRTTQLTQGLAVGAAVPDGTPLTTTRYVSGMALVFNFTPDFFRFASGALLK